LARGCFEMIHAVDAEESDLLGAGKPRLLVGGVWSGLGLHKKMVSEKLSAPEVTARFRAWQKMERSRRVHGEALKTKQTMQMAKY